MSKKHFVAFAKRAAALRIAAREPGLNPERVAALEQQALGIEDAVLAVNDNPRFDSSRFIEACRPE